MIEAEMNRFQEWVLKCSNGKSVFRQACCNVARSNQFSGKLAAMQQGQNGFQASLLQCSKGKMVFRQACCNGARAKWFSGELAVIKQVRYGHNE
jgi:hypothetical protein